MPRTIVFMDEVGEIKLPAAWAICTRCRGDGKHGNPAFDGMSTNEFAEDPEFAERYFAGDYDVRCRTCNGTGKVLIADHTRCTPEQIQRYVDYKRALRQMEQEQLFERMLEAGPNG